jgi:hypothetical protein
MIPSLLAVAVSCVVVQGDRILMEDLAKAIPAFAAAPAAEVAGLAPAPRIRRTFPRREIERLAARYGIEVPSGASACFEGASELLTKTRVRQALDEALRGEKVSFTLLEFSRYPVPHGQLEFGPPPRSDTDQAVIWRGSLRYGVNRSVAVWARVRLVRPPLEVERGDAVEVEVRSGAALLRFDALAESGGRAGDLVFLRNPESRARFSARVVARGKVVVDANLLVHGVARGRRDESGR